MQPVVHLKVCYWKEVLIPKYTLLTMTHYQGIIVCLHPLLVWLLMVLISVNSCHTKDSYVTVWNLGTSSFLINYIVLVTLLWLSIPLASIRSSFPTAFHQVSLSSPINKVYIAFFKSNCCRCGKQAVILINGWQQGAVLLEWINVTQSCTGKSVIGVELARMPLVFSLF